MVAFLQRAGEAVGTAFRRPLRRPGTRAPARPELYAPAGACETFRQIVSCWGDERLIEGAFTAHEYQPWDEVILGPFQVRFCEVPHYMPTYAVDLSANGYRLTYSSDCAPNDDLVSFARGTDRTADKGDYTLERAKDGSIIAMRNTQPVAGNEFADAKDDALAAGVKNHLGADGDNARHANVVEAKDDAVNTHEACFAADMSAEQGGRPIKLPLD